MDYSQPEIYNFSYSFFFPVFSGFIIPKYKSVKLLDDVIVHLRFLPLYQVSQGYFIYHIADGII